MTTGLGSQIFRGKFKYIRQYLIKTQSILGWLPILAWIIDSYEYFCIEKLGKLYRISKIGQIINTQQKSVGFFS